MNLAQSLGAAAAALVMGLSPAAMTPAQTGWDTAIEAHQGLQSSLALVGKFTALLEQRQALPAFVAQYRHLRVRIERAAHNGADDRPQLAAQLAGEPTSIPRDAHLLATLDGGSEPERRTLLAPPARDGFGQAQCGAAASRRLHRFT
jgi:hypothetical protein